MMPDYAAADFLQKRNQPKFVSHTHDSSRYIEEPDYTTADYLWRI